MRVKLTSEHDFAYRAADVEAAITPRTRAIFINTPNNPTGAVLSAEQICELIEVARRHDLWIVSDEAYEDVVYAPQIHYSVAALAGDYAARVVSIFSCSKSYAMAGLRTGYIVTTARLLRDRLPKLLRCSINGVNSLAQWGALAAVNGPRYPIASMRTEYRARRDIMFQALDGISGVRAFLPRGAFFIWAELDPALYERLEVADADELADQLAREGIGSAPGSAFGKTCRDALRFSFSCDTDIVRRGAARLREVLS